MCLLLVKHKKTFTYLIGFLLKFNSSKFFSSAKACLGTMSRLQDCKDKYDKFSKPLNASSPNKIRIKSISNCLKNYI